MKRKTNDSKIALLAIIFIVAFVLSFMVGKYKVTLSDIFGVIFGGNVDKNAYLTITVIRLPRIVMASIVGAGLSVAGAVYQSIFRNSLASQDVLGSSQGSAFGATVALLFGLSSGLVTLVSFVFGVVAILLVFVLSAFVRSNKTLGLILSGMLITSVFSAGVSLVKLVADPTNKLPSITYWLMGSFASVTLSQLLYAVPVIVLPIIVMYLMRYRLNVMCLGDIEARTMGVNVRLVKVVSICCATLISAMSVSLCGMIGWVGLIIPHLCRLMFGSDYRHLLPACIFVGGTYMLAVDCVARVIATSEVPIGILTSLLAVPVFVYLIVKEGKRL